MNFNENGTIAITISGKTYTLKRPTIAQLSEFEDLYQTVKDDALAKLTEWNERLAEDPDSDEAERIRTEMSNRRFGLEAINEPWLRKAFETLGTSPLPDSLEEGPSELVSGDLLPEILRFWRSVPLARSSRRS